MRPILKNPQLGIQIKSQRLVLFVEYKVHMHLNTTFKSVAGPECLKPYSGNIERKHVFLNCQI